VLAKEAVLQLPDAQRDMLLQQIAVEEQRRACQRSFLNFLPYWQFVNRETGEICSFQKLWAGQQEFAELTARHRWILALKAGKLGFTELECAYDAWVALFGGRNSRVHVFSRDDRAAQELIGYIRFGLRHLPDFLRPAFVEKLDTGEGSGATQHSLKFKLGLDDVRRVVCYAAGPNVSVDQSCQHAHVDELARMPFPKQTWQAVYTTIAPEGSCHVVTRGAGEMNFVGTLWEAAAGHSSQLYPFFQPWTARPGRDRGWYELQAGSLTQQGLAHYAPENPADALAGDEANEFIPIGLWDRCWDKDLSPLLPGASDPIVLGVDAAVSGDCFGIVAVTRHPAKHSDVAVRAVRKWDPPPGGSIDFFEPECFLRFLCQGGCAGGHPQYEPWRNSACEACESGPYLPPHNVVQIAYDPYQLESMMQSLKRDMVTWCEPFGQQKDRLIADSSLRDLVVNMRISHDGNQTLRDHVQNAGAKVSRDEDSKIRIVKKAPDRKVDLLVATSMAAHRCLYLVI